MESDVPSPSPKKRRRTKHCDRKRSSSSHESPVEVTTSTSRPTIIATATSVSSSSKSAPSREEAAIAMATVLASELRPEHKLPRRDILVQPQPQFMELLQTVGAKGPVFTARQVLSYLIKYISSRQLYIQQDPKRVYCEKDPLGKVFGVPTFTIKDARKLLFENMSVLREAPDFMSQHNESFQRQQRKLYYTFHQSQQTTDVTRPIPVPTRSATAPSPHSVPTATVVQVDSTDKTLSSVKNTVRGEKYTGEVSYRGEDHSDGALRPRPSNHTAEYPMTQSSLSKQPLVTSMFPSSTTDKLAPLRPETINRNPQSAVKQPTPILTQVQPKVPTKEPSSRKTCTIATSVSSMNITTETKRISDLSMQSTTVTQGPSILRPPFSRGLKRKHSRLTSDSSEDTHISSHQKTTSVSDNDRVSNRPWYCMLYHPSEELKSQSSEVLSIQDCETAIVADSSDDLWFVNEDERTPVEYDVPSDSSDDYTSNNKGSSDDSSSGTELVYNVLLQQEDSGDSHFADNSDEDSTDTEISDLDKWECIECSMRNSPFQRYCSRCWALRKGWLPDNQRMTLKERLQNSNRPLRRSFSAPAGNANPISTCCQSQPDCPVGQTVTNGQSAQFRPASAVLPELDAQNPSRGKQAAGRDFADGIGHDMPDGKTGNGDEDEAGTGTRSSAGQSSDKPRQTNGEDQGENSQDTVIVGRNSDSDTLTESEDPQIRRREDSGIGLTQESSPRKSPSQTTSSKIPPVLSASLQKADSSILQLPEISSKSGQSHSPSQGGPPHKRQRAASGPDLSVHNGSSQLASRSLKLGNSIHQLGMGVDSHPLLTGKSDPGAGPSSQQSNVVTKHYNDLCIICYSRPKSASIIHGRTGHQVCCYPCAKKLQHRRKPCPVCRRTIQAVIKNFLL